MKSYNINIEIRKYEKEDYEDQDEKDPGFSEFALNHPYTYSIEFDEKFKNPELFKFPETYGVDANDDFKTFDDCLNDILKQIPEELKIHRHFTDIEK